MGEPTKTEKQLAEDARGTPIQGALECLGSAKIAATGATARVAAGAKVVEVHCAIDCFIQLGGDAITAAASEGAVATNAKYSIHLPANTLEYVNMGAHTHIAVITGGGADTFYISKKA